MISNVWLRISWCIWFIFSRYSRSSLNRHSRKQTALLTAALFETVTIQTLYFYILVSGHSHKQPRTLSEITTWTFSWFLSFCKQTSERKSTTSVQCLVFINQPFYIAVRHNDFTVITVPYFNICFVIIHVLSRFETPLTCICACDWNYNIVSTL